MKYIEKLIYLSPNQIKKLDNAVKKKSHISLRIDPKKTGNISLLLTQTQVSKLLKESPFDLKLSLSQIKALAKHGGFLISLPILLGVASAIGSLAGGASAIAKTINDKKVADKQLKEIERHNKRMEEKTNGKGLFLKPYPRQKTGEGLFLKPSRN